jgi:hypothetical protein
MVFFNGRFWLTWILHIRIFWHKSIGIYTFIADSLVTENFGDNMIPLNLNELQGRFLFDLYSEISCNAGQRCRKNCDSCTVRSSCTSGSLR